MNLIDKLKEKVRKICWRGPLIGAGAAILYFGSAAFLGNRERNESDLIQCIFIPAVDIVYYAKEFLHLSPNVDIKDLIIAAGVSKYPGALIGYGIEKAIKHARPA